VPDKYHILPEKIIRHYNPNVIGVQVTFQRKHWKGGEHTLLLLKPYNSDNCYTVKEKSCLAAYWIGFFFIPVYIHAVHKGV
jgi:hypothetical protein